MLPQFRRTRLAVSASLTLLALSHGSAYASDMLFRVPLKGMKPELALSISPVNFDFGGVKLGQAASANFTISNAGGTTASNLQYKPTAGYTVSGNCGPELGSGASCIESVTFTPTTDAPTPGTLTVTNGTTEGTAVANFTALGLQTSDSRSAGSLSFGNQKVGTTSSAQSVTLTNTGNTPLSVGAIGIQSGPYAASTNCGSSLPVGSSCTVNVTFTPTAVGATGQSGTLVIPTQAETSNISLTGAGVGAVLAASPGSLAFANQSVNTSSTKSFTLTNSGNAAATLSIGAMPAGFSQTNNCGGTLAVGGSCAFNVTFTPTASGNPSGTMAILGGVSATNIPLSGQSTCAAGAQAFTSSGTFSPTTGCSTYLVLVVGGGGGGATSGFNFSYGPYSGAGGSGYVNVSNANGLTTATGVTVGSGGAPNGAGATSCFGGICAGGGNPGSENGPGGAGGSGGGYGSPSIAGWGGNTGGNSSDGYGAGQGNFASYLALFHRNSITGGGGGQPASNNTTTWGGGGGGGILYNGSGPTGGQGWWGLGFVLMGAGGSGYGAGGGGGQANCTSQCFGSGGSGASGLVYVEWSY